jgi:hypothetical protein
MSMQREVDQTQRASTPMIDLRKMWIGLSRPPREIREAFGLEDRP